jgi:hypothetical protein
METDADRLAMISGLGGVRVFAARGEFLGLLEMAHVGVGEVAVDSEAPMLSARSSDLARAGVTVGTTLTISGETYIVRSIRKDGLGMAELMLEGP